MSNRGSISLSVIAISRGQKNFNGHFLRCESDSPNEAKILVGVRKISLFARCISGTEITGLILCLEAQKPHGLNLSGPGKFYL